MSKLFECPKCNKFFRPTQELTTKNPICPECSSKLKLHKQKFGKGNVLNTINFLLFAGILVALAFIILGELKLNHLKGASISEDFNANTLLNTHPLVIDAQKYAQPIQVVINRHVKADKALLAALDKEKEQDYLGAQEAYREIIEEYPATVYEDIAEKNLARLMEDENAMEILAAQTEESEAKQIYQQGLSFEVKEDYASAGEYYRDAIEKYPDSKYADVIRNRVDKVISSHINKAKNLLEQSKFEDVVRTLDQARQISLTGSLPDEATKLYDMCLFRMNMSLARKYMVDGDFYEAGQYINKIKDVTTTLDAADAEALAQLEKTLGERWLASCIEIYQNAKDTSVDEFAKLAETFPESPYGAEARNYVVSMDVEAVFGDVDALVEKKDYKTAIEKLQDVMDKYPETKYSEKAQEKIDEVTMTKDCLNTFMLVDNYLANNMFSQANRALEEIIRKYPDSDYAKKAQEMLNALNER